MIDQAQSLRNLMNKNKGGVKVIAVTSAKGGVGKSSVALNLAIALSQRGKRMLVVDMDFGLANIDVMLGVRSQYDLLNVIEGDRDLRDIIATEQYGVHFISGGSGVEALIKINTDQLKRAISNLLCLEDLIDIIIFDTGAGITDNILRLICASHQTILVTTPEPTAIMDAYALMKTLSKEENKPELHLVVNKADSAQEAESAANGFIRIAEKYTGMHISNLGVIYRDSNMIKAVKKQVPLLISFPKSEASLNISQIADRFLDKPVKLRVGISGFIERLLAKKENNQVQCDATE
ncbi:MAG: MinD/ParA family protein [Bacillota bacterium]